MRRGTFENPTNGTTFVVKGRAAAMRPTIGSVARRQGDTLITR
jgi:hypothetical protein